MLIQLALWYCLTRLEALCGFSKKKAEFRKKFEFLVDVVLSIGLIAVMMLLHNFGFRNPVVLQLGTVIVYIHRTLSLLPTLSMRKHAIQESSDWKEEFVSFRTGLLGSISVIFLMGYYNAWYIVLNKMVTNSGLLREFCEWIGEKHIATRSDSGVIGFGSLASMVSMTCFLRACMKVACCKQKIQQKKTKLRLLFLFVIFMLVYTRLFMATNDLENILAVFGILLTVLVNITDDIQEYGIDTCGMKSFQGIVAMALFASFFVMRAVVFPNQTSSSLEPPLGMAYNPESMIGSKITFTIDTNKEDVVSASIAAPNPSSTLNFI